MTKKIYSIIISAIFLFTASAAFSERNDAVLAKINGKEIKSSELMREVQMMYQQSIADGMFPDDSQIEEFKDMALDMLIGRELLLQEAEQKNYKADPSAVEEYINSLSMNYGGIEVLEEQLLKQDMTLEELRRNTERYQLMSEFIDKEFRNSISLDKNAAEDYYAENKDYFKKEETVTASHILIKTSENADEKELKEAYEKISSIRERIIAGESFEDLAQEYSECPSGQRGGDLGEFGHGSMVPPFDRAAFSLDVGELSQPVQTRFGYHIILCTAKSEGAVIAYDDVKDQIISYLTDLELEAYMNEHVENLKKNAEIIIFEEEPESNE